MMVNVKMIEIIPLIQINIIEETLTRMGIGDKKGWSILEFMVRFNDTDKLTLDDICQLLLCAVEYKWRKDNKGPFTYSDINACEWLEEMGGFGSEDWNKLLNHFASDLTEEKKNQEQEVS